MNNVLNNAENSIQVSPNATIHQTAILEGKIIIEDGVFVGPYCIINGNITLSKGVSLLGHVIVSGNTTIGENTTIYHFASIGSAPQDIKYNNEKSFTTIGKNNIIREHVTINSGTLGGGLYTTIGDGNLLMISSHIGHDSKIANNCKIANNVAIAGHVILEDGVVIGGNSAVHQFVRMGAYSMLGGMSGTQWDIPPFCIYTGINRDNKIKRLNVVGLRRNDFTNEDIRVIEDAYDVIFKNENFKENIKSFNLLQSQNKHIDIITNFMMSKDSKGMCIWEGKEKDD